MSVWMPAQLAHRRKTLDTTEQIDIAMDLVPAELGISAFEADIVVGYGLDANPAEIYFHKTPLNLTVQPES